MKNKGNSILIVLSVLFVGAAGFFIIKALKTGKQKKDSQGGGEDKPTKKGLIIVDDSQNASPPFPIKKGSKSEDIKIVQQAIMRYDARLLPVFKDDGKWGIETQTALQKILKKSSVNSQEDLDKIDEMAKAKLKSLFTFGLL